MTNIVLFGANGNIGLQALDVVKENRNKFNFVGLGFGHTLKSLPKYLDCFPEIKYIFLPKKLKETKNYKDLRFFYGSKGLKRMIQLCNPDVVLNAVGGFAGLEYSLVTIEQGCDLALANKESLVCGGSIVNEALKHSKTNIFPVDSEHSTLYKLVNNYGKENIDDLILTASGGAFRDLDRENLKDVDVKKALNHPTWNMGSKVTIDSDTLMNKTYEIIEAFYLFNFDSNHIKVLLEKTSHIHSLVKLSNGNYSGEVYDPSMLVPIFNAIDKYKGEYNFEEQKDLSKYSHKLEEISFERYPFLKLGFDVISSKGNINGVKLNAIDEICVDAFLNGKISFLDIEKIVFHLFKVDDFVYNLNYKKLLKIDKKYRKVTEKFIKENY